MKMVANMNYSVPDDLHRRAKAAAALEGVSLKDFLLRALEDAVIVAEKGRP